MKYCIISVHVTLWSDFTFNALVFLHAKTSLSCYIKTGLSCYTYLRYTGSTRSAYILTYTHVRTYTAYCILHTLHRVLAIVHGICSTDKRRETVNGKYLLNPKHILA